MPADTPQTPAPLPCPFCGGAEIRFSYVGTTSAGDCWALCLKCGLNARWHGPKAQTRDKWNRRASLPSGVPTTPALRVTTKMALAAARESCGQHSESFDAMWGSMSTGDRAEFIEEWRTIVECALGAASPVPTTAEEREPASVIDDAVQGLPDAGMDEPVECVALPALMAWPTGDDKTALEGDLTVAVPAATLASMLIDALGPGYSRHAGGPSALGSVRTQEIVRQTDEELRPLLERLVKEAHAQAEYDWRHAPVVEDIILYATNARIGAVQHAGGPSGEAPTLWQQQVNALVDKAAKTYEWPDETWTEIRKQFAALTPPRPSGDWQTLPEVREAQRSLMALYLECDGDVARDVGLKFTSALNAVAAATAGAPRADGEDRVVIWSDEHQAYWGPNGRGYHLDVRDAGLYTSAEAHALTDHCGPEKRIELRPVTLKASLWPTLARTPTAPRDTK